MIGIFLSFVVALLKSLGELAWKVFTSPSKNNHIDEYSLAFGGRLMWVLLILPVLIFIPLQTLELHYMYILFCWSLLNAIATVTALKAVKYGELSVVGPLTAFTIPLLLLSGYFIVWELPNMFWIFGVFLIFLWTYYLWVTWEKQWFFWPITSLWKNIWARYMWITAIIWSITWPLDKLWILEYWVFLWMLYTNCIIVILMFFYLLLFRRKTFQDLSNPSSFKKISIMTCIWAWTLLIQMFAIKLTLVIYVISIKRASGIFSIIFGYFFFWEKNIQRKLFAASVMIIGVSMIALFWNI